MNPIQLLSAYEKETLCFRVYGAEMPILPRGGRYRLEHFTALDLLGAAMAEDFHEKHIKIERVGMGKPKLLTPPFQMNLSHCTGLAVCAVGKMPLGLDTESGRFVKQSMIEKLCTEPEREWIFRQSNGEEAFSRIWTLKESYAKYLGMGISIPFQKISFSLDEGKGPEIRMHFMGNVPEQMQKEHSVNFYQIFYGKYTVSVTVKSGDYRVESKFPWISGSEKG